VWPAVHGSGHSPGPARAHPIIEAGPTRKAAFQVRWTPSKILKITGLSLVGAAPFAVALLLLPSGNERGAEPEDRAQASSQSVPLEFPFPFASPSPFPSIEPEPQSEPSPTASVARRQCENGRDDDRDGRVDTADAGCSSRADNSEAPDPSPAAQSPAPSPIPSPSPEPPRPLNCGDQGDNDGDGYIDGEDPGCEDGNESPFNIPRGGDDDDDFFTTTTKPSNVSSSTTTQPGFFPTSTSSPEPVP
jgi:hypothetical protein